MLTHPRLPAALLAVLFAAPALATEHVPAAQISAGDTAWLLSATALVLLIRRKMGRVTDVEWLVRNADYAQEIIRLACQQVEHPEVADWGAKLRAMLFPRPAAPAPAPAAPSRSVAAVVRYVGGLR